MNLFKPFLAVAVVLLATGCGNDSNDGNQGSASVSDPRLAATVASAPTALHRHAPTPAAYVPKQTLTIAASEDFTPGVSYGTVGPG